MSSYPKFLPALTVPTGGWTFSFEAGGTIAATLPAGDYDTILHAAAALETAIDALVAVGTVDITSVGITTIFATAMTSVNWGSCSDDLLTAFGFEENEPVSSNSVTSNLQHTYGWYPGLITYGTSDGCGPSTDTKFLPEENTSIVYAGSGSAAMVKPARDIYKRKLEFTPIYKTEVFESRGKSPLDMTDRWRTKKYYYYPDRDDGTVGTYGTQMDPGHNNFETDADHEYYIVTLAKNPAIRVAGHVDWNKVTLQLAVEPK